MTSSLFEIGTNRMNLASCRNKSSRMTMSSTGVDQSSERSVKSPQPSTVSTYSTVSGRMTHQPRVTEKSNLSKRKPSESKKHRKDGMGGGTDDAMGPSAAGMMNAA